MPASAQQTSSGSEPSFTESDQRIGELLTLMHPIADMNALASLSAWDQNTALPPGAAQIRGHQLATAQGIINELQSAPRIGTLVAELEPIVKQPPYTDADRGLVRYARRMHDHATRLPRGLIEEMARVEAGSFDAWHHARANNDFASFAPWLTRTVALKREVADRLGYAESRYDALLDLFEEGLTASTVSALFAQVRDVSLQTLRRIQSASSAVDASILEGHFAEERQLDLSRRVLTAIGYDFNRGGIAVSPHPFTTDFGSPYDVRLTVHPSEQFLQASVMAAIHEGGHALYEQGSAPVLARTLLAGGASLGAHESQSRLWENAIGRSEAFWHGQFHHVREVFPEQFTNVDAAAFARALNAVQPSLIRIEADEVTYNLHIIIRFELEQALVAGEVSVESLPGLWNQKYQDYLGVTPDSDTTGVLQDVHWTSDFGYFPTYTLGNLYAAQIYATLRRAFPDFDDRLASGDTSFILNWLRERMYAVGAIYTPADLIERVTGEKPDPGYFAEYLTSKYAALYGLPHESGASA